MSIYTPDDWVVLCMHIPEDKHYRVLAGWYGGFAGSNSWKMNSGITQCERDGNFFLFTGESGSVYHCHKDSYRVSSIMSIPLRMLDAQEIRTEIMHPDTNWVEMKWRF